jgi:peroxiredoxin family protein
MATIHLAVLKQRQKSNGHFTIYIVVTHKRDVRYITTAYEVDDLFQFENGKVVCRKDTKIMNQRLQYTIVEYQEKINAIRDVDVYSCSQIKDLLEGKIEEEHKIEKCISIKEYLEMWIKTFVRAGIQDTRI